MTRSAFFLLMTVTCTIACAQTTQSIDRTTPRGAAAALRAAVENGDEAALRDLLYSADADSRQLNDALADVISASAKLSIAASERFGGSESGKSSDPIAIRAFTPEDIASASATTAPVETIDDRRASI
jgi:hypothetical protein